MPPRRPKKWSSGSISPASLPVASSHTAAITWSDSDTDDDASPSPQPVWPKPAVMYTKLINRFFEPLVLLYAMGNVRGERMPRSRDTSPAGRRHDFLDDLAFLCERTKGGDTCTAIGLEGRHDGNVFWVASNSKTAQIRDFLDQTLQDLADMWRLTRALSPPEMELRHAAFIGRCIAYAKNKVKKQKGLLDGYVVRCANRPLQPHGPVTSLAYQELLGELEQLRAEKDLSEICWQAWDLRRSSCMATLNLLADADQRQGPSVSFSVSPTSSASSTSSVSVDNHLPFYHARHYIGRLADSIRVPQRLFRRLGQVTDLIESPIRVITVPPSLSVPRPQIKGTTTLESICGRMVTDTEERDRLSSSLVELDRRHHILDRFHAELDKNTFKPRVHCEILVLDHFYSKLQREPSFDWFANDRYIGCSKPACYCCHLYLKHHPARPVVPNSHQKQYVNWGPRLLTTGAHEWDFACQRRVLQDMLVEIRSEVKEQIRHQRGPYQNHPDSHTGILSTVPAPEQEEAFHSDEGEDGGSCSGSDSGSGGGSGRGSSTTSSARGSMVSEATVFGTPSPDMLEMSGGVRKVSLEKPEDDSDLEDGGVRV